MLDERKIATLGEEIKTLSGYDIYFHYIKGLELSRYIFDKNYQDLAAILNFVTADPRGNKLHRGENKDKLNAFGYEIVGRFHNYVTAAETLVSHSRTVHTRLCEKKQLFPDYDERVNADFNENPLAGFILELRYYFLYEQSPDISFNIRIDDQGQPMRKACIPLEHLHGKKDWKARSHVFLQNLHEDVEILELASTFKRKVTTFQDWFRMRLLEVFKEELAVLDGKMVEMRRLLKEA